MIRSGACALPDGAISLRWLANELRSRSSSKTFVDLLKALAPDEYARLGDKSPMNCYLALVGICDRLFPTYGLTEFDDLYESSEDPMGELEYQGVPVGCLGVDTESDGPCGVDSPAVAVCLCWWNITAAEGIENFSYHEFECLKDYLGLLTDGLHKTPRRWPVRPRGWDWVEPWDGLGVLFEYSHNNTGHVFLDMSYSWLYSGGVEPVPWDVEEINNLARMWERSKPVWERITALRDYVDEKPGERLQLLEGALGCVPHVMRTICYPKR